MSGSYHRSKGLYKDSENGIFLGVCAGLANYFDFSRRGVRIIVAICFLLMFWPTLIAYLAAGFLLRHRPLCYCGRDDERSFWRHNTRHDHHA